MNLEELRLTNTNNDKPESSSKRREPQRLLNEPFVSGVIPWSWLCQAAVLPGKALAIGMCLWFRKGLEKSYTVRLSRKWAAQMGIKPDAGRRGLRQLEFAGLVKVVRHPGCAPVVTIVHQSNESIDEPSKNE